MITTFANVGTQHIFEGKNSKKARETLPMELWAIARMKLDRLNAARELRDLDWPRGNRLKTMKGPRAGQQAIRINDQYRLIFFFEDGNAEEVAIEDYH